jgi:hypothetical protein
MLWKLIAAQVVKKFSFYGTLWFIAKFRRPYYYYTTPYHEPDEPSLHPSLRFVLIGSCHLRQSLFCYVF